MKSRRKLTVRAGAPAAAAVRRLESGEETSSCGLPKRRRYRALNAKFMAWVGEQRRQLERSPRQRATLD